MAAIKKEDFEKAMENLKKLGGKMKEVARVIEKDTIYGAQIGKLKLQILGLEKDKNNKLKEVGKTAYKLVCSGKLKEVSVTKQCSEIKNLEKTIKRQKAEITQLMQKIKEKS